jgi:mono/diheme cytochrome c family protein
VKVTDPNKLQYVTDQYKAFVAGQVNELPDMRRVFLDAALEDLTFKPKAGLSGRQVLVQQCAQCHNPNLDQSISRAKFDVTRLDSMSAADKQNAINRMKLPASNRLHMPPAMMRNLTPDALNAAIAELSK